MQNVSWGFNQTRPIGKYHAVFAAQQTNICLLFYQTYPSKAYFLIHSFIHANNPYFAVYIAALSIGTSICVFILFDKFWSLKTT